MSTGVPSARRSAIGAGLVSLVLAVHLGACTSSSTPLTPAARFSGSPEATARVPLARSTWQPGQSAMAGSIPGTLTLDEAGCIRLEEQGGQMQWLVWPEGWTAEVTGQEVVITEPSGKHSLRTGEPVELGGGFIGVDQYAAQPCASGQPWQVVGANFK